jgi:hypothetical protein
MYVGVWTGKANRVKDVEISGLNIFFLVIEITRLINMNKFLVFTVSGFVWEHLRV